MVVRLTTDHSIIILYSKHLSIKMLRFFSISLIALFAISVNSQNAEYEESILVDTFSQIRNVFAQNQLKIVDEIENLLEESWQVLYGFESNGGTFESYSDQLTGLFQLYFRFIEDTETDGKWQIDQLLLNLERHIESTIVASRGDIPVQLTLIKLHNIRLNWHQALKDGLLLHHAELTQLSGSGLNQVWPAFGNFWNCDPLQQEYWRTNLYNKASDFETNFIESVEQRQKSKYEAINEFEQDFERTIAELYAAENKYYI